MSEVITTFSSCSCWSRLIRDDGHAETRIRCGDDWEYIKRISADDHGCWGPDSPIGGDDGRRRPRDAADDQRLCIRQLHCICQLKARSHSHMYSLELKSEGADWPRSWTGIKNICVQQTEIFNSKVLCEPQQFDHITDPWDWSSATRRSIPVLGRVPGLDGGLESLVTISKIRIGTRSDFWHWF